MSSVTADDFGGLVPEPRIMAGDVREKPPQRGEPPLVQRTLAYGQEPVVRKWAAWKVSLFVIVFCGAFWAGAIYLATRLLG
ncbi:MAG: hypothetical protein GC155_02090 [Alphaproteobacteria bacterium]|nr:hypothetical protein [Alphaproteobacteria bacterium]